MWKLWLLVAIGAWRAAAAESWLTSISQDLRSEMTSVLEMAHVNYSEPNINVTYIARIEFDMRAMGPLYNITPTILDTLSNKQAYPEGIVSVADGHVEVAPPSEHWQALVAHYAGPIAFVSVCALLVCALPLAGVLWCCCYWCRGGRRRRPFDRKRDACLKGLLAIVLIALLTLFLFGVVSAFVTEEQLEEGVASLPAALSASAADTATFLDSSARHMRHLLVDNYRELDRKLQAILTSSGMTVSIKLGEFSRAVSVTALNKMVNQLDEVQADLRIVHNLTQELRTNADDLNSGLRRVKGQLIQTLAKCDQPQCKTVKQKYKIGQLDTEIHYNQMPDVTALLRNVTALIDSDIKAEVGEGQRVFQSIQLGIQRSVDQHIPSVQAALTDTGRRLEELADEVARAADAKARQVREAATAAQDFTAQAHRDYGLQRRLLARAAAGTALLVTLLLAGGLLCGVCGKRPDVYQPECCSKASGSRCLLCGVVVMFVGGGALALAVALGFVLGLAAQRGVCDPLQEPRGNRLFADAERFVDLERALYGEHAEPGFGLGAALLACHANRSLYAALHLHRAYDLQKARAQAEEQLQARERALHVTWAREGEARILRASARDKLLRLADSGLSDFDFERILAALETNVTSVSLEGLAEQLEEAARGLAGRKEFEPLPLELSRSAAQLRHYQRSLIAPMLRRAALLNGTALRLRDGLRFNHSSLKDAVGYLLHETAQAERFLSAQGPQLVHNLTREFAAVVAAMVGRYMDRVQRGAETRVGLCGPLSHAFNSSRDALCRNVLLPHNGFWLSLSWCVLLFVPLMVVAQRLARLYLHVDPYPGPLVEAEYLYDAYADRDNVPLANAFKADKRAGAAAGGHASGAGRPRPGDAHSRRYNDMAPKHWEEGPPRYHGPTEYERPPPYYYPGPNDGQ